MRPYVSSPSSLLHLSFAHVAAAGSRYRCRRWRCRRGSRRPLPRSEARSGASGRPYRLAACSRTPVPVPFRWEDLNGHLTSVAARFGHLELDSPHAADVSAAAFPRRHALGEVESRGVSVHAERGRVVGECGLLGGVEVAEAVPVAVPRPPDLCCRTLRYPLCPLCAGDEAAGFMAQHRGANPVCLCPWRCMLSCEIKIVEPRNHRRCYAARIWGDVDAHIGSFGDRHRTLIHFALSGKSWPPEDLVLKQGNAQMCFSSAIPTSTSPPVTHAPICFSVFTGPHLLIWTAA
ncbi:hypothetical protein C2845_PM15G03300 [Panicum miliaceum]|uniref:Uncharacterized protein n=1 Tax=Panicum miliaceum TaxID=4540 RepID=A0A3L6Q726_PANMI|nr:hypothetical protein C2845_PM15G03300 [Panicum miliaceum]